MPQPILFTIAGVHNNLNGTGLRRRGVAPNFCGGRRLPVHPPLTIAGVSRDSAGAALGSVECVLLRLNTFGTVDSTQERYVEVDRMTSDGAGAYSFSVGWGRYRVIFFKAGPPDVAGTTDNDLAGA